jgi:hypothetical protein
MIAGDAGLLLRLAGFLSAAVLAALVLGDAGARRPTPPA